MENQINYSPAEETIDIRKFIYKVMRKWYWFVLSISIAYTVAFFVNRWTEPIYSISSTLLINDEKKSTAELLINSLDRANGRKNIENEIAVLKSYSMTNKTINQLKDFGISYYIVGRMRKPMLYKTAPFSVITDSSANNLQGYPVTITLLSKTHYKVDIDGTKNISKICKFGEPYIDNNFNFTIFLKDPKNFQPSALSNYYFTMNNVNGIVNQFRGKLYISANDKRGTVLTLSTTGTVPQMEADYLNKLMEVYIQSGLDEKNQTAINTINFIDEQLSTVVDSLRKAEDKLQNFRLNNQVIDISTEGSAILSHLEKVQQDKTTADMQMRYLKYVQDYIEKKKDFREVVAPAVMGIDDELLNSLVGDLSKMYGERSILMITAQKNNPSLSMINAKIQNIMEALRENIKEIIHASSIQLNELGKQQALIEIEIKKLPITERKLLNIQRDFKLNDQIYNFLLQKRADAAISKASNVADNRVLDDASAENRVPISPQRSKNQMIALVLGLLFPLSILVIIEFFNDRILDIKDIEKITKVPIFGSVGHNEKTSDLPVAENPKSTIAESFRALRTNLQYVMRDKTQKVICISSTISGEGKTFCAVNLAAIMAQGNKKTLLLSFDLRKPKVHRIFNLSNEIGISTYLIGKSTYEEVVLRTNIENLYVVTAGPVPPNPAELLDTVMMEEFIARVRNEFDIILMDTPPIAIVTDAVLLTRFSDGNIFVVRHNYSTKDVLNLVDDLCFKRGINIGILVNDVKFSSYYGYGKKYSYSYGYGNVNSDYYGDYKKPTFKEKIIKNLFG